MWKKEISKKNVILRIAQRYPFYIESKIDEICRLFRRFVASLLITTLITFIIFGWGLMITFGFDVVNLTNSFLLFLAALGITALKLSIGLLIIGAILASSDYIIYNGKVMDFMRKYFCSDNVNDNGQLYKIAQRYDMYCKPPNNTCRLIRRVLLSISFTSGLTFLALSLIVVPLWFWLDFGEYKVLNLFFSVGTICYVIIFIVLFGAVIEYVKSKISSKEKSKEAYEETKKIVSAIKESKLKKFCIKLKIVE